MFTGIIEGLGRISAVHSAGQAKRLSITADFDLEHTRRGDSICVSGACLTVVNIVGQRFDVDVSPETIQKTTFGHATHNERVNLERAMRLSDRIDGHLVSGHVDGVGIITHREKMGNAICVAIRVPRTLARYMITKGSVAVDGVSLTINACNVDAFTVSVIPHTAVLTTIGLKKSGEHVNIETDMIGKYVERFLKEMAAPQTSAAAPKADIDMDLLARSGYL